MTISELSEGKEASLTKYLSNFSPDDHQLNANTRSNNESELDLSHNNIMELNTENEYKDTGKLNIGSCLENTLQKGGK